MSSKVHPVAIYSLALLLVFASSLSCSAKKWPGGIRKPRKPGTSQPAEPQSPGTRGESESAGTGTSGTAASGPGTAEVPKNNTPNIETALPGEVVSLLANPAVRDFSFRPQAQSAALAAATTESGFPAGDVHPRLYFNAKELQKMQGDAKGSRQDIAERIFAYGDKNYTRKNKSLPPSSVSQMPKGNSTWRVYGDRLMGVAAAYALSTDPDKKRNYRDWCVEAMNRFSTYPSWGPNREYAVGLDGAHIVFGFSVAYDVLFSDLNKAQRDKFAARLRKAAGLFYKESQSKKPDFWVKSYTNNHNYLDHNALLNAALVLEPRYPETKQWIEQVRRNTATVMELRASINDGSTTEGVMYGTYGAHGLFATLDLLDKHKIANHFDNPWLKEHFNFLLHGSQPGYKRVVGVADGHGTYGHGPQHLLYFLDKVMRDGRPTWLAQQIFQVFGRQVPFGKPEGSPLLFEFMWRDTTIQPKAIDRGTSGLFHLFDDWGVATFRRGWSADNTFFSFRAGSPAGKSMWELMLKGDPRLAVANVSHSHPDAGGFSFYPNGNNFIAGAGYDKPKRTALANTYTFTPAFPFQPPLPENLISKLWDPKKIKQIGRLDEIGQVGEWQPWMGPLRLLVKSKVDARIVAAVYAKDSVFVSGEIGDAYPKQVKKRQGGSAALGLSRLYRNMLLLPEDVLLIVDRVESKTKLISHNYFRVENTPDRPASWSISGNTATLEKSGSSGSSIDLVYPKNLTMDAGVELNSYEDAKGENRRAIKDWKKVARSSSFLRISNPNQSGTETYVYLLRPDGKKARVYDLQMSDPRGVSLKVESGDRIYAIRIAMDLSTSARQAFLGFDGYVKLDYSLK
jgi:hypothetical protein